jgi:hypothetical protein
VRAVIRAAVKEATGRKDELEEPAALRKMGPAACDMGGRENRTRRDEDQYG